MQMFSQRESDLRAILSSGFCLGGVPAGLPAEQGRNRRRRLRAGLTQVVGHAIAVEAGLVVIAGDLFGEPVPKPADLGAAVVELSRLREHGIAVVAITGDRDRAPDGEESPLELLRLLGLLEGLLTEDSMSVDIGGMTLQLSVVPQAPADHDGGLLQRLDYRGDADFHMLLTHYGVESLNGAGKPGGAINLDAVRALLGVDLLVAGGGDEASHGRAGSTTVAATGDPSRGDGHGGFLQVEISRRGLEGINVIPGLGGVRREIAIVASTLAEDDAQKTIRAQIEPLLEADAEIVLRVTGRTEPETLRAAGLAGVARWARALAAGFELDLSALRIVDDELDSGPGQLSPLKEMSRAVAENETDDALEDEAGDVALASLRRVLGDRLDAGRRR